VSTELFFTKPNSEYHTKWNEFIQTLPDTVMSDGRGVTLTVTFGPLDAVPFSWRTRRHDEGCSRLIVEVTNSERDNVMLAETFEAHNTVSDTPNWGIGLLAILMDNSWLEKLADMQAEYGETLFKATFFNVEKFLTETNGKMSADLQAKFLFTEICLGELVSKMRSDMETLVQHPDVLVALRTIIRGVMEAQSKVWEDDAL